MPSKLQTSVEQVLRTLVRPGECVAKEVIDRDASYSIDFLLLSTHGAGGEKVAGCGGSSGGDGMCEMCEGQVVGEEIRGDAVAIEIDGPSHFLRPGGRFPAGSTLMKRRHLAMLGYRMV